ncbi:MAG TPA: LTA synthase family protein, partial [Candidatus Mediterraneibacter excrementigallinarum]|nr:LTA synthase family protein [Candidatus Mediterraneibacter excrementigallinarum]
MKRIHIRKPDIKGFFVKVRHLKKEDIKRHFKEKKERRQKILEERRNSKTAKMLQPVYKWMNRLSLPLHFLLACVINFLIELISRLSFFEAWDYMVGTPLVFLYNAFLIFATFSIVYLVRRRTFARILLSVFWLFLGICNGYLLTKRVTPFNAQDLKVLSDALEL